MTPTTALVVGAGVVATVVGFSKTIEPLIELGLALVVMALIANPKPRR
jgi:hypothetical protein